MVIADFQMEDKVSRPRFFQKTFLVADTKFEVVLRMSFLKMSNVDVAFGERTLTWKSYITNKVLPTTKQVQLFNLQEFIIAALNADSKNFVVYIAIWEREEMPVYLEKQVQVGAFIFDEASTEVLVENSDYSDVFSAENAAELPENTRINEHAIKLEEGKQPPFGPIYSLDPVELEALKTYIKTNLANGFIRPSKSLTKALILFDWKPNGSFCLCMDYWGLNNITIKNRYQLPLIGKSFNWLSWAKQFTQLDLINAYHRMRICKGDEWKTAF